jgi:hypothetical protein
MPPDMRSRVTVGDGGGGVPAEQSNNADMSGTWAPEAGIRRRLTLYPSLLDCVEKTSAENWGLIPSEYSAHL